MAQIAAYFYISLLSIFGFALLVVNLRMLLRARRTEEAAPRWTRYDPARDSWRH